MIAPAASTAGARRSAVRSATDGDTERPSINPAAISTVAGSTTACASIETATIATVQPTNGPGSADISANYPLTRPPTTTAGGNDAMRAGPARRARCCPVYRALCNRTLVRHN
ncbi:hypothetical protein FAF44_44175 [Nonomuraea sp. MG754425]|nr:hypothetical protein [Nonomuraea sp. MG754425]